ncbi:MAG: hypothetical protein M1838_002428 [Thelocarpon superellum]|nr:MAG: hypothetical protein M1838_002428 [Thelocarpon superellum]
MTRPTPPTSTTPVVLTRIKPLLRAYALGYLSSTSPRLVTTLASLLRNGRNKEEALSKLFQSFRAALALDRFPAFCGLLIGGSTLLQIPLGKLLACLPYPYPAWSGERCARQSRTRQARFLAALVAAYLSLSLLNRRPTSLRVEHDDAATTPRESEHAPPAVASPRPTRRVTRMTDAATGRTMDLTLFAATRAVDVIVGALWARRRVRRIAGGQWTQVESWVGQLTDAAVFALSASVVMWSWFYHPHRLPRAYNQWIKEAAEVDGRLVTALRRARSGELIYGEETGQAPLLQGMCRDLGLPVEWGDPARTVPFPCDLVHMGTSSSCEVHAASRFARAFKFALATYLPLTLILRARSPSLQAFTQAFRDAMRSSSFLAAFISLFYYSICLSRTRLGPKLFSRESVSAQQWDSGLDIGIACTTCGWSILIEAERRRQEVAFFVAPRAAAIFFPRRYDRKYQWRENLVFALSTAVVFTCVQENPPRICQQTGWGGQPIKSSVHATDDPSSRLQPVTDARRLRITFNGSVSDVLPWKFTPQQREVRVLPGETALAFYTATNKSEEDIIGVATYSVTPGQVAPYFSKIQCFCFEEQRLNAGETVDMPVFFFIDPDFVKDPQMKGIDTVTLSYTFFKARYDQNGNLKPFPTA